MQLFLNKAVKNLYNYFQEIEYISKFGKLLNIIKNCLRRLTYSALFCLKHSIYVKLGKRLMRQKAKLKMSVDLNMIIITGNKSISLLKQIAKNKIKAQVII